MTATKRSAIEWAAEAVKVLLPVVAIGWYAAGAIQRIEAKASDAVARVAASVQKLETAQALSSQRQDFIQLRLERVERRQEDLESVLGDVGIRAAAGGSRQPKRPPN